MEPMEPQENESIADRSRPIHSQRLVLELVDELRKILNGISPELSNCQISSGIVNRRYGFLKRHQMEVIQVRISNINHGIEIGGIGVNLRVAAQQWVATRRYRGKVDILLKGGR